MPEALVVGVTRQAIELALMVSLPMLLAGLVAGVLVSMFQTVTSIQDSVLGFIPRARDLRDLRADVSVDAPDDLRIRDAPSPAAAGVRPVIDTAAISKFGLLLVRPGLLVSTTPVFGGIH